MTDINEVRRVMSLQRAMAVYGKTDKERFPCVYPEFQESRPDSSFFADFCVASVFGEKAIEDTYRRAVRSWKSDVKMYTELTGALNHMLWFWHEEGFQEYAALFDRLWKEADGRASELFKGADLNYFVTVLD